MSLERIEIVARGCGVIPFPDEEVAELALLLPTGQAAALEAAARQRGLTTAQLTRQLIRDFLDQFGEPRFPEWG
jgi:hypothetical protein